MIFQSFASHEAPHLSGLHFQHAAVGHSIPKLRMANCRVKAAEPCLPKGLPASFVQEGAVCAVNEVLSPTSLRLITLMATLSAISLVLPA